VYNGRPIRRSTGRIGNRQLQQEIASLSKAGRVLTANLREHPAVRAWGALAPARVEPDCVVVLKRKENGAVYRLAGVGPGGSAVIAKRCRREKAAIERAVYERVLPRLPLATLDYHGFVEEEDGLFGWLFLEDVGDERYSPADREHRALAAQWLALLHTVVEDGGDLRAELPERGPDHYRGYLRSIRAMLPRMRALATLPPDALAVLESLADRCERLESSWSAVEASCRGAPAALVHADCLQKNVHVRASDAGRSVAVFDWGGAGWGLAATDLGQLGLPHRGPPDDDPDYAAYLEVARRRWPQLDLETVGQLSNLGQLFWALKVIARGMPEYECDWARPEDVTYNLRIYEAALARSMRLAGSG
jgi:mRNA-degrading endonuclease YafQ of YafQ-DinJ toxin-antitoxin module